MSIFDDLDNHVGNEETFPMSEERHRYIVEQREGMAAAVARQAAFEEAFSILTQRALYYKCKGLDAEKEVLEDAAEFMYRKAVDWGE